MTSPTPDAARFRTVGTVNEPTRSELSRRLEGHRRELTALCRRELGSACEAEDAVQETLVRAWGRLHQLEDPGALRAWLRRIATNVCHDMRDQPQRRA